MRPKYLTLSAFGPYADKVEIDFDKLGAKGLYIITGATGAGKTTIFDAISYALFGKSSSKNRDNDSLRSMYADITTPTFVELTFTLAGRDYTVKRNPNYFRQAKRGNGTTEEKANVELTMPSGDVLSKKDAEEKLSELLCITHEQFKKIVMIAQGEFRDVLQADTKERQRIFRHIFGTEIYNDFARELIEARNDASENCTVIDYRISGNLEGLTCEENSGFEERTEQARKLSISYEEISQLIEELISVDELKYAEAVKNISGYEKKLTALTEEKEKNRAICEKAEKLEIAKKNAQSRLTEKSELEKKLAQADSKGEIAEKYKRDVTVIEKDLPEYDRLSEKTKQVTELKLSLSKKKSELDACTEEITCLQDSLLKKKTELADLSDAGEKLIELNGRKDKTDERLLSLSALKKTAEKVSLAKKECEKSTENFRNAFRAYNEASEKARELRKLFNCEQAGIMAELLTEGMPCPVCGSTVHPDKAVKSAHAPSEADTEKAEAKEKEQFDVYNKASADAEKTKTTLKLINDTFTADFEKLFGSADTSDYSDKIAGEEDNLRSDRKKIIADIRTENTRIERRKALSDEIPENEKKLVGLTARKTELASETAQAETLLMETEKLRTEIASKLSFSDKKKAEAEIIRLKKEAEMIENERKTARLQFEKCKEICDMLAGEIESVSKELEGKVIPDLTVTETAIKELAAKKNTEAAIKEATGGRLSTNKKIREQFTSALKELAKAEEEYNMINDLCDTANGQIKGKQKIQLETFIQAKYFDKILHRANRYLMQMSSGQYMFERREGGGNQAQSGLDLNVIDSYNGSKRNVSSLSGGEAFFASLSLALGLSEEVKESAGGIHLDCMFVDEGFGSLDGDTLNQSMNALKSISTDGMLIGIISHVETLEKEIDNKIVVSKTQEKGSTATVVV